MRVRRRGLIVVMLLLLAHVGWIAVAYAVYDAVASPLFWVAYLVVGLVLFVAVLIQLQWLERQR